LKRNSPPDPFFFPALRLSLPIDLSFFSVLKSFPPPFFLPPSPFPFFFVLRKRFYKNKDFISPKIFYSPFFLSSPALSDRICSFPFLPPPFFLFFFPFPAQVIRKFLKNSCGVTLFFSLLLVKNGDLFSPPFPFPFFSLSYGRT